MSELKQPRRASRDAGRSDIGSGEPVARDNVETIAPEPAVAPQPAVPAVVAQPLPPPESESVPPADDPWTLLAEAQIALARGVEEIAAELSCMTRSGIAATSDATIAMFGAKTFAEAIEINAGLARRGVDALIEGSTKVSEIGVRAMTQASQPILSRLGAAWSSLGGP